MALTVDQIQSRVTLRASLSACDRCPIATPDNPAVPFYAPPAPTPIVVVGEAPGRLETVAGRPFVGIAGQIARLWLRDAGVDSESVGWVNAVSHLPTRHPPTPNDEEVGKCREWLEMQLEVLGARYVLVLGRVALSAWWEGLGIGEGRGHWWHGRGEGREGDYWGFATYHPASTLGGRSPEFGQVARDDVGEFAYYAGNGMEPRLTPWCCKCWGRKKKDVRGLGWCGKKGCKVREREWGRWEKVEGKEGWEWRPKKPLVVEGRLV